MAKKIKKQENKKINGLVYFLSFLISYFLICPPALALSDDLEVGTVYQIPDSSSLFYLGTDLHRYIFPNSATFESWYDDFDDVVMVETDVLNQTPIGGLVTVKPGGETWVKIQSDPKVYTVSSSGVLHWIPTESAAETLGGENWASRIIDLPDTVFAGYSFGTPVDIYEPTMDFDELAINTISEDKSLVEPAYVRIQSDPMTRTLAVNDDVATIYVGNAVHFENTSTDQYPEVVITGNDDSWSSGIIEGDSDFITYFYETGFYHYTCRNAYDFDAPVNSDCGTVTVVEYNIE